MNFIKKYYADVTVGAKLTLDGAEANKTMKDFKQEIRQANEELLNTRARFGETSKEALEAAKKVAMLKDEIKDANETVNLFDPGNKFQIIGNAVRGLVGGFTALQGALALVGVEGDQVQKTLLKVQSALALSEGLSVISDVGKDFKRLGAVIVQTLGKNGAIGLAIAGVTALGLALSGVFTKKQRADLEAYNDTLEDYSKAAAGARQQTIEVKIAFEQARAGVISKEAALKIYNDTLGDSLGRTNDLSIAEKNLTDKADAYIRITGLKAQANALFAKAAEQASESLINQDRILKEDPKGFLQKQGTEIIKQRLAQSIEDSKQIEQLAGNLLRQAAEEAKKFDIKTGGVTPGKKESIKKEVEEEFRIRTEAQRTITAAQREEEADPILDIFGRPKEVMIEAVTGLYSDISEQGKIFTENEKRLAAERLALSELEAQQRVQAYVNIGSAFGALADLIGKETAAGKVLAIAQATINTWLGVTEVLKTKSVLPEPLATISRIANIATVIASGLNAVKQIGKAKVPGAASAVSVSANVPAPVRPQVTTTSTRLDQQQINQIGNATVRAFVVESDVTNNQERIRRLNRAARI